jgi:hypothetical protein
VISPSTSTVPFVGWSSPEINFSWVEEGKQAMMTGLVAQMDHLGLQTLFGRMDRWNDVQQEEANPPKH